MLSYFVNGIYFSYSFKLGVSEFLVLLDIFSCKCFPLSNHNQKTYTMKSRKKKSGIHSSSCRTHSSHPAAMTLPPLCALGNKQGSPVSGVLLSFLRVLHGFGQCSLIAETLSAAITMSFVNSGNFRQYTEVHQHKRHNLRSLLNKKPSSILTAK